jgi:hypothetical protein
VLALSLVGLSAQAEPIPEKYQQPINKGLLWLKKTQTAHGSWSADGRYPIAMTSMAGLAMLMEGSTPRQGSYATNIRAAMEFIMSQSNKGGSRDGLIGNPDLVGDEAARYMYGHGFAMLFLASLHGEEMDKADRDKLRDILTRAALYSGRAQSTLGGWHYKAKGDPAGWDRDEGSVTVTQMQGLRACRDAGIPVPAEIIKKGYDYLRKSTSADGGVVYQLSDNLGGVASGKGSPSLTAAAIACLFSAGKYDDEYVKKWLRFTNTSGGVRFRQPGSGSIFNYEYTHFYYAPTIYFLGEDGWQKRFPGTPKEEAMTWSKYRHRFFESAIRTQSPDGSWTGLDSSQGGTVFATAVHLVIMQLDNNCLPIFQR